MFQFQVGCSILGVYLKYAHKYTSSILKTNLIPTKKYTFCILFAVYFDYIKCILQVYYKMVRELVHLSKILLQWLCNRENGKKIKNIMIKRLLIFNKLVLDKTEAEIFNPIWSTKGAHTSALHVSHWGRSGENLANLIWLKQH